jgi:hypothetical protein
MSTYIEAADLEKRWPVTSTWGGSDELEEIIGYAESYIEGRLAPGYSVPFSTAYPAVKDLCIDESYRRLLLGRSAEKAEELRLDIDRRITQLLDGDMTLVDDSGGQVATNRTSGQVWSETMAYKPTFDMRDAEYQHIDPSRLEDEEDADEVLP